MAKLLLFIFVVVSLVFATGQVDYNSDSYINQFAGVKLQQLWANVTANKTSASFFSLQDMRAGDKIDMFHTMDNIGDALPVGIQKYFHTVGSVAQVKFIADPNTIYTGMFRGASSGIIRLSTTYTQDQTLTTAAGALNNFLPTMALKLLRDNLPSANVLTGFSRNGYSSWNFFSQDFSTHLPISAGLALQRTLAAFSVADNFVQIVGLNDMAQYDQYGKLETSPKFPWKLIFRAPTAVSSLFTDDFVADYQAQLETLQVGTILYNVYAVQEPSKGVNNCQILVGQIQMQTAFTKSSFGDNSLFFRHGRQGLDLAVRPDWTQYTPFWHSKVRTTPEGGCPFKRFFR